MIDGLSSTNHGAMKLSKVTECKDENCPAVYVSDRGTAVIQGVPVEVGTEGLTLGDGESAVELPPSVVLAAVGALQEVTSDPFEPA